MVSVDKAFEVRYKKKGKEVQVLVDFDKLQEYRKEPEKIDLYDVLADNKIYTDQKKGEIASEDILKQLFDTVDEEVILTEILISGECQIPTAYLNKLRDEKKEQIVQHITENAFNPQTKTKYTYSMIERAFNELHFHVDPFKSIHQQGEEAVKALRKKLPLSMEKVVLITKVPGQYCGNFYGKFRSFGNIKKDFYDEEGSLHIHMEMFEGTIDSAIDFIKKNSNSEAEYHVSK